MKLIGTLSFALLMNLCWAQDYFELRSDDHVVYNYPKSVEFTLIGDDGAEAELIMDKKYKEIQVAAPWYDTPMIYKNAALGLVKRDERSVAVTTNYPEIAKPKEMERSIDKSVSKEGRYNLELTFSNDLLFSYVDGQVKASQKGEALEVLGRYLVQTEEGLFKISFNPANGRLWYVIEL